MKLGPPVKVLKREERGGGGDDPLILQATTASSSARCRRRPREVAADPLFSKEVFFFEQIFKRGVGLNKISIDEKCKGSQVVLIKNIYFFKIQF